MNVRELIDLLAQQDPDAEVEVSSQFGEGCSLDVVLEHASYRNPGGYVRLLEGE
jgi:hypothetical protein